MGAFGGTSNLPLGTGSNPMGMLGLDMGLYNMPLIGGMFQNPMEQHQHEQMSKAAEAYTAYRPEYAQARMNALANQMSTMQGAQNAMNRVYGSAGDVPTMQALRNPMGPSMMQQGAAMPSQNPNQMPFGLAGGGGGKLGGKLGGKGGDVPSGPQRTIDDGITRTTGGRVNGY